MKNLVIIISMILITSSFVFCKNGVYEKKAVDSTNYKCLIIGYSNGKHIMITDLSKQLNTKNIKDKELVNEQLNKIRIYPNPAINNNVILECNSSDNFNVTFYGIQKHKRINLFVGVISEGLNKIPIDLEKFKKGLILIYCSLNGQTISTKLMKH